MNLCCPFQKTAAKCFLLISSLYSLLSLFFSSPVLSLSTLISFAFYRALNIRVALVGLEVWSDVDKCPITQDPFTTLHEFLDWRKVKLLPQKPHDNAQLISGVYFQGTTIGMAPIMSMCTAEQSGGIDHSDNPLGAAVTLAHELGHNFGMNHDTPERGCGYINILCFVLLSTGTVCSFSFLHTHKKRNDLVLGLRIIPSTPPYFSLLLVFYLIQD
uniref:ADAM metallopeptidase domain 12 n=1 Tax=Amphiprion percula TaxID=161767 RepID=A0A3P8TWU2_AMPPE